MTLNFKPTLMRHRVTFQSKTRSQDSNGLETFTWLDVTNATSIPASVIPLSGKEIITSQQVNANYKARVTIYKNTAIDESMRMSFNGNYYNISDILPDPTNEVYYNLMVTKYV